MDNDAPILSIEDLAPQMAAHETSPGPHGTIFGTTEELPPKELAERVRQHAQQMTPRA